MEVHQRSKWIIEQRRQHSADLSAPILGLHSSQNQVVFALLHKGFQDGGDAPAVRSS